MAFNWVGLQDGLPKFCWEMFHTNFLVVTYSYLTSWEEGSHTQVISKNWAVLDDELSKWSKVQGLQQDEGWASFPDKDYNLPSKDLWDLVGFGIPSTWLVTCHIAYHQKSMGFSNVYVG